MMHNNKYKHNNVLFLLLFGEMVTRMTLNHLCRGSNPLTATKIINNCPSIYDIKRYGIHEKQTHKNRKENVMEDNEELVSNETENVEELATEELVNGATETTTEEVETPVKTYTDDEVDEIVKKKLFRQEQKLNRNFEKQLNKYKYAEEVLNAGLGTSNISEATDNLSKYYQEKGIEMPKYHEETNQYDMEAGAEKEANSIIESGIDDVREETDRLAQIGLENMSARDKIIFSKLAEFRKKEESKIELSQMGVKADLLDTKEYKDFVKEYNLENTPVKKIYELYKKTLPQEEVEPIGSMKNVNTGNAVKEYYTPDEVRRLTEKELDNPDIMKAVEHSMAVWYQENIK